MAKRKITAQTDNSKWEAPKKRRKPRKPMTEEQRVAAAERLEKARAVRAANNPDYGMSGIHESIRNLPDDHQLHPKKVKQWIKTQKDLLKTEKQSIRQNVKGAIAKAREARAAKNPDYGKSGIAENLRGLPDDHPMSPANVKKWIKTQKGLASAERAGVRQKVKGAEARLANHESYIRNCQTYLRTGDWVDDFYGEHQQGKIRKRCIALAYYWYGPKKGQPKRDVGTFYPDMGCVYTQEIADKEREIASVRRERKTDGRSNSRSVAKNKKKSKSTRR